MAKLRAAAYCRVSSNKSIQLRSLKAQKKYYEEYFRDNPLVTIQHPTAKT